MSTVITVIERAKVDAINREYRLCKDASTDAVTHAVECGRMLAAVKADLSHGDWLPWLTEHFEGSSETAALWMRMAANPERVPDFLTVRDAKQQLAKPRAAVTKDAPGMLGGLEDDDEPTPTRPRAEEFDQARDRLKNEPTTLWTVQHERRQRRIEDLLGDARELLGQAARPGLTAHAIAETLRAAEVKAAQARGQISELAFSFER